MATSSTRRARKTTDFTDFFRAGHSTPRHAQSDTENYFSSSTLDVPGESSSVKKKTKIPFLGRTRKKSTHSTASSHGVPCASRSDRESADVSTRTLSTDQRPNALKEDPAAASRLPQLTVKPPPVKSTSSLGSKFAAHFTPTKSRKPPPLSVARSSPTPSIHTGGTLSPPFKSPRATSFDSGSSGASQNRSTTPRPAQPSITVSFSPDSVEEYKDLFTLPKNKTPTSPSIPQALTRSSSTRRPEDSDATPRSTPPLDPPFRSAEPHDSRSSRSQGYSSDEKQLTSSLSRMRQPSNNSSVSKRADPSPLDRSKSMVHRREVGIPGIVRPSATPAQLYATSTRTPLPAAEIQAANARRARTVSAVADRRSGPPTMPLPLPPAPDTPPPSPPVSVPPSPQITFQTPATANVPKPLLLRPRANTISTVSNDQGGSTSGNSEATSKSQLQSLIKAQPKDFDIHSATPQQLKAALVARNRQYDELSAYLLKITETHATEVAALEKKIYTLEKETTRKDKEIKGLTWLVNNPRGPPVSPGGATTTRIQSGLESDQESARASSPSGASSNIRRYQYTDDSGVESYATSGAESPTSGAESMPSIRGKSLRVKRPFTLGESSYNLYRATMGKRATEAKASNDGASTPTKRASSSSLSPSTTSSSSLLPSGSSSTTVSSLSAIPETTLQPPRDSNEKVELGSRSSNRVSTSSTISSASSNYASNLKRSRPPSIAQVLEKSEKLAVMDEALEQGSPA